MLNLVQEKNVDVQDKLSILAEHTKSFEAFMANPEKKDKDEAGSRLAGMEVQISYLQGCAEKLRMMESYLKGLLESLEEDKANLAKERRDVEQGQVNLKASQIALQGQIDAFKQSQEKHQRDVFLQQAFTQRKKEALEEHEGEVEFKVKTISEFFDKERSELLRREKAVADREAEASKAQLTFVAKEKNLLDFAKSLQVKEESLRQQQADVDSILEDIKAHDDIFEKYMDKRNSEADVRDMKLAEAERSFAERMAKLIALERKIQFKNTQETEQPETMPWPALEGMQATAAFPKQQLQVQPPTGDQKCFTFGTLSAETHSAFRNLSSTVESTVGRTPPATTGTFEATQAESFTVVQETPEHKTNDSQIATPNFNDVELAEIGESIAATLGHSLRLTKNLEDVYEELKKAGSQENLSESPFQMVQVPQHQQADTVLTLQETLIRALE